MTVPTAVLISCLETFLLRALPDNQEVTARKVESLLIRRTNFPTPMTNLIGLVEPTQEVSEEAIAIAVAEFKTRGLPFGWLVGPYSPDSISGRLAEEGMLCVQQFDGLALRDLSISVSHPSDVSIRDVAPGQEALFSELFAQTLDVTQEMADYLCTSMFFRADGPSVKNYFAFVDGSESPVGIGSCLYDQDRAVVTFAASGVLEAYRHRGVYHSLIHHRLLESQKMGMRSAIIQALSNTSAPICRSLGFEQICNQKLYAWLGEH